MVDGETVKRRLDKSETGIAVETDPGVIIRDQPETGSETT